jgi:hypothetical protein
MVRMNIISIMDFSTKLDKLCVPKGEILHLIKEAHTSKVVGNFGVGKTIANLRRYMYWPRMQEDVALYIR